MAFKHRLNNPSQIYRRPVTHLQLLHLGSCPASHRVRVQTPGKALKAEKPQRSVKYSTTGTRNPAVPADRACRRPGKASAPCPPAAPAAGSARGLRVIQPQRARAGPGAIGRAPAPPRRAGKRFGFLSSPRSAPRQPINAQRPPPASHSASQSASAARLRQSERSCQRAGAGGGKRLGPPPPRAHSRAADSPRRVPPALPRTHRGGRRRDLRLLRPAPALSPARLSGGGKEGEGGGQSGASAQRPRNKMAAGP